MPPPPKWPQTAWLPRHPARLASSAPGCLSRRCTLTLSALSPTLSPHTGQLRGSGLVFFICGPGHPRAGTGTGPNGDSRPQSRQLAAHGGHEHLQRATPRLPSAPRASGRTAVDQTSHVTALETDWSRHCCQAAHATAHLNRLPPKQALLQAQQRRQVARIGRRLWAHAVQELHGAVQRPAPPRHQPGQHLGGRCSGKGVRVGGWELPPR